MKTLFALFIVLAASACSSTPYWAVYKNDGLEKRMYLKEGWPRKQSCRAYASNRPIQRSTWAKQHYWKGKTVKR